MFQAPDYRQALAECVEGYEGEYERTVLRTPEIFDFYSRLYADERLNGDARRLVSAVLAYFVAPRDVMPEELLGPYGLLDDCYLAAHVFRLLEDIVDQNLLSESWRGHVTLARAMSEAHHDGRAAVGKERKAVLTMAGIR
jgi:uncharacterized membrane protein YkvA (DUF1232 family)